MFDFGAGMVIVRRGRLTPKAEAADSGLVIDFGGKRVWFETKKRAP
jgi:hypothetical protein